MQPWRTLLLTAASLHAASAFHFTGPPTDEPLDLSRPITITWDRGNTTRYNRMTLWFYGGNGTNRDEGELVSFGIGPESRDLLIDEGSWEWDPVPRVSRNQNADISEQTEPLHHFTSGRDYYFSASFFPEGGEADDEGNSVSSGNYTVVNWDTSAAGRTAAATPLLALVGIIPVVYNFL